MKDHADTSHPKANLPGLLLKWYDREGRDLPWRVKGDRKPDPYHVWLSEIMLQQTTVATVGPYFNEFLQRWPDIHALARAKLDDVLHAWQGLGYYARARNLHKCAVEVAREWNGEFPESEAKLRGLPGIGPYTAAAIAAIAFQKRATAVDGNVERVMSRMFAVQDALPKAKPVLQSYAADLTPRRRPGDYAQALMDLGATICTSKKPACGACPWSRACRALIDGAPETYPRRAAKTKRPTRYGTVFWMEDKRGRVLVRRRPEKGLLGGMMEVPSSPWKQEDDAVTDVYAHAPAKVDRSRWVKIPGEVSHTFTHFHLILSVERMVIGTAQHAVGETEQWCLPTKFDALAFPTVMKKVIRHVLER